MTRQDMIKTIINHNSKLYNRTSASRVVDTILDVFEKSILEGKRIEIRGFGALSVKKRRAGFARNPKTNDRFKIGERIVLYFRAGKELNAKINSDNN